MLAVDVGGIGNNVDIDFVGLKTVDWEDGHDKTVKLQAAIAGDGLHFVSVVFLPYKFQLVDGLASFEDDTCIKMVDFDNLASELKGHRITFLIFELIDGVGADAATVHGDINFDVSTAFRFKGNHGPSKDLLMESDTEAAKPTPTLDLEEIEDSSNEGSLFSPVTQAKTPSTHTTHTSQIHTTPASQIQTVLKELSSSKKRKVSKAMPAHSTPHRKKPTPLKDALKMKQASPPAKAQPNRLPFGWSFRPSQQRGPQPTCNGCGGNIAHRERRIRHVFRIQGQQWNTRHQFHCRASCLRGLSTPHRRALTAKKWSEREMAEVVQNLGTP